MVAVDTSVGVAEPPTDPADLVDFPTVALEQRTSVWRAGRQGYGPWWFDSSAHGRFNLPEPNGTCYLALDEVAAVLDVVGPDRRGGMVSREFLGRRKLRKLSPPKHLLLADLTSPQAADFGATTEVGTVVPYELPRAWARRLSGSGLNGLRYRLRSDLADRHGIALFGKAGERTAWRRGREMEISDEVLEKLTQETGLAIAEIPRADQLRVVD